MKRFKIKNKINNVEFMIEGEQLGPLQPEWGKPARPEMNDKGLPTGVILPAEFTIVEEDITVEVEDKKKKQEEKEANEKAQKEAQKRISEIDLSKVKTIADVVAVLGDIKIAIGK